MSQLSTMVELKLLVSAPVSRHLFAADVPFFFLTGVLKPLGVAFPRRTALGRASPVGAVEMTIFFSRAAV